MYPVMGGWSSNNQRGCPIAAFADLLSQKQFKQSVDLLKQQNKHSYDFFRGKAINVFSKVGSCPEFSSVIEAFISLDLETKYLSNQWLSAENELFKLVLEKYKKGLENQGKPPHVVSERLVRELEGLLTFREFTEEHAQIFVSMIPDLDLSKKRPSGKTIVGQARFFASSEVAQYFQNLAGAPEKPAIQYDQLDLSQFKPVEELKDIIPLPKQKKGTFLHLNTVRDLYAFIGRSAMLEADPVLIKENIKSYVEKHEFGLPEALERIQEEFNRTVKDISAIQALIESQRIEFYGVRGLDLDHRISYSQSNVGTLTFKGVTRVCKIIHSESQQLVSQYPIFNLLQEDSEFLLKCQALHETVPNVVQVLPKIIINKTKKDTLQIGYLMALEPGKQLAKIKRLSPEEKIIIQDQFEESIYAMLKHNYALYDFHEHNILWDGKKLTMIDLVPAGFKPEVLAIADTEECCLRLRAMVKRISTQVLDSQISSTPS